MAFVVNIIGDIAPFDFFLTGSYVSLADVEEQLRLAKGDDLLVNINSRGGDVDEGFSIYLAFRRYAKLHNASITTKAVGKCDSIATVVFLAGDNRIANPYLEPFMHEAWTITEGESRKLIQEAEVLERLNNKIAKHYASHTNLTYEEARELMKNGSYLSPEEALNVRFATEIEEILRPVALKQALQRKSNIKMNKKKTKDGFFNAIASFFNETVEGVEVLTSTGESIVFFELEEGATPKVGDKATVDGQQANGDYLLQDGTVYKFENGSLTEIEEKEESGDSDATLEELRAENAKLKEQIEALNTSVASKIEGLNTTIATLKTTVEQNQKTWNNLKTVVSNYAKGEELDNSDKSQGGDKKETPMKESLRRIREKRSAS